MIFLGCDITFYAVIAIDHRFRIVSLTPTFSCIQSASDGRDRTFLYSAFTAASVLQAHIIQDTTRFQNNPPAVIPTPAHHFPAVSALRKYPASSDGYFNFEIQCFFPNRHPTAFCMLQRCQGLTNSLSSSSLLAGTQLSCTKFAPRQVMHHQFLLLSDFLEDGLLWQWNILSLASQSLTQACSLLTEAIGWPSSRASIPFIQRIWSMVTCGMRILSAKMIL